MRTARTATAVTIAVGTAGLVAGCATTAPGAATASRGGVLRVVAAEDFWGSIASQLGGSHVHVTSIITNPDTDPHSYEPTAADARTIAEARVVIVNQIGYDTWADNVVKAAATPDQTELGVGTLLGIAPGGNPHRWYSPADVAEVVDAITADYEKADPADKADFARLNAAFVNTALAPYHRLIAEIRTEYAGTPIGASESIVAPLAEGLGLDLVTPAAFLDAISEDDEPTTADKSLIDRQIRGRQIKVYVYNSQNATPDVQAQVAEARAAGIPVTTVTETPAPAGISFQDWQVAELRNLETALAEATGR
jgi:zinc/manganese transport system substrate-binding protein